MREDRLLREKIGMLVDTLFESRLDAESAEQLEELVTQDPLACRYYFEIVGLYDGLCRWSRERSTEEGRSEHVLLDPMDERALPLFSEDRQADMTNLCDLSELDPETVWGIATSKKPSEEPGKWSLGVLGNYLDEGISFLGRYIVLVIVLLPLLAIGAVLWMSPTFWESPPKGWMLAARIANTVDCQWKQDGIQPSTGHFLIPDQKLELERGLAELEFSNGVKVVLQGPAEFTIADENTSILSMGRLAATVPEKAIGFTIETPHMDVVDLGTQFGIVVENDGDIGLHVFKGKVEAKVTKTVSQTTAQSQSKQRACYLEKDQAIQYNQATGDIAIIPIDRKSFVCSLSGDHGISVPMAVANPSFELPDILTVPEFQQEHGNTLFRPIEGWKVSGHDQERPRVAGYQIAPYRSSPTQKSISPNATDGQQIAAIFLGADPSPAEGPRSSWIYQSLGTVTSADLGKTLKLSVDAGPRHRLGELIDKVVAHRTGRTRGARHPPSKMLPENGRISAGFALHVTPEQRGSVIGIPDTFAQNSNKLHRLESTVSVTPELVDQELFIVLAAGDDGSTNMVNSYYFDNVTVTKNYYPDNKKTPHY